MNLEWNGYGHQGRGLGPRRARKGARVRASAKSGGGVPIGGAQQRIWNGTNAATRGAGVDHEKRERERKARKTALLGQEGTRGGGGRDGGGGDETRMGNK
jgi:hypothetical protein